MMEFVSGNTLTLQTVKHFCKITVDLRFNELWKDREILFDIRSDTHMTSTLSGGSGWVRQKCDVIGRWGWGGGGVASVLEVQFLCIFLFFLLKKLDLHRN